MPGDLENVFQVGRAVLAGRCRKSQEDDLRIADTFRQVRGEAESALFDVTFEQDIQVRFVNRDFATLHTRDFRCVDIDAYHVVTGFREARAGD